MKKLLFSLFAMSALCLGFVSCTEEIDEPGSIYGVVTDKATGEPIRSAGVELSPTGMKTVTGSEGQFEFTQLNPGQYTLLITKAGYTDYASSTIQVTAGQQAKTDVQIEQLPPALKVVNDHREEISELDFGSAEADIARSFNIFNDGVEALEWEIVKTADWIENISKESGTLKAGGTQAIIITIDRSLLKSGENKTTVHITSNNGSKQLTIVVTNNTISTTLNTLPVTNIKTTSAVFNGKILSKGTPAYTERGFVYNTQSMPTIENTKTKLTLPVTEQDSFSIVVTNLEENTPYFVRAYAINGGTVSYSSNEVQFTPTAVLADVVTMAVTDIVIKNGAATFNGNILDVGDPAYTERGFVYGLQHNPTIEDDTKKVVNGKGLGEFNSNVSGLQEGNTYYVRAFATNAAGTVYGQEVSFSTEATMPTVSTQTVTNIRIGAGTATFNGTILTLGDLNYTERGFVYAATHNPTIDDIKISASGTGTGTYSVNATNIAEGATYYVRAYATNSKGTVYGEEVKFDFNAIMPVVTTQAITGKNIALGVATLNGRIEVIGDPAYTERGFVYSIAHSPTKDDATIKVVSGTGKGDYTASLSNIAIGTIYYIRAYATNSKGTIYGEEITLDFNAVMPTIKIDSLEYISTTSAKFSAVITEEGDLPYTERGFVYGTMAMPTKENGATIIIGEKNTLHDYYVVIDTLKWHTSYNVCAYVENSEGIVYSDVHNILMEEPEYQQLQTIKYNGYTYVIYTDFSEMTYDQASSACTNLIFGGYSDWYLPSVDELLFIAEHQLLGPGTWWSSQVEEVSKTYMDSQRGYRCTLWYYYVHVDDWKYVSSNYLSHQYYTKTGSRYPIYKYDVCAVRKYKE